MGFATAPRGRVTLDDVKKLVPLIIVLVALTSTAAALSSATAKRRMSAHLTTRVEVPKPRHVNKKAFGAFTGTFAVQKNALELTWKLSFVHLTGSATGVTLSEGKPGYIGKQITVLCKLKQCKSGMKQTTLLRKAVMKALLAHQGYVTVYTRTNPAGELRGQIRVKG
jgi:CHRD domain